MLQLPETGIDSVLVCAIETAAKDMNNERRETILSVFIFFILRFIKGDYDKSAKSEFKYSISLG